jgi:hypothetical protein
MPSAGGTAEDVDREEYELQQEAPHATEGPPAVNVILRSHGDVFVTERGVGSTAIPPEVGAVEAVTNFHLERNWNVSATMELVDSEGNVSKDYEYEVEYDNDENPNPNFNRVEGRQSPNSDNGEANLGAFSVASRRMGTDQNSYNPDMSIPSIIREGSGTVTITSRDGSTAKVPFTVDVDENNRARVTPASTQVKWTRPSQ